MLTVCVWHEEGTAQESELDGGREAASERRHRKRE